MVQDIIAYIIILAAFCLLFYRVLQFFNLTNKKPTTCGGCVSGCSLKELNVVKKAKFDKDDQYRIYL